MRWLLPGLLCAQALGIGIADRGLLGSLAAGGVGGAVGLLGLGPIGRRGRCACALVLAFAAGALAHALRIESAARPRPLRDAERTLEACIGSRRGEPGALSLTLVDAAGVDGVGEDLPRRLRLRVSEPVPIPLDVGVCLRARVRLSAPRPLRNPGGAGDSRRGARRGIGAVARLVDPALVVRLRERERAAVVGLHALRRRAGERLERAGEGGALLRALALGDRSGLGREVRERFARLGIAHLLAVSGLHLGLVAGAAYALARRGLARSAWIAARWDTRDPARAIAVLAALLYALLSGFGVPVRRALVLVAVLALATWRGRRCPSLHPLAVAGLGVLALDPAALFAADAQLSFAACGALLWSLRDPGSPARGWRARLGRGLRASAVASAVTAPLAALHLGVAAPLAVLVNGIAIPWTAGVLLPLSLLCAGGALLPAAAADAALATGERVASLTLHAAALAAPLAPWRPGVAPHPAALGLSALLAAGVLRTRALPRATLLAVMAGVVLWLAPPPGSGPPPPRLVALDVGGGDAIVVQGRRAALLVDAGAAVPGRFDRGAQVVVPALRALGIARLDLAVASHADLDHRGGLPAVLAALPVGAVWIPGGSRGEPGFEALHAAAAAAGARVLERGRGSAALALGDLHVEVLWPPPGSGALPRNERSLALRVTLAGRRVLLLGDLGRAEAALLRAGRALRAEVLVLPHHGSRHSSGRALLAAVAPEVAIVSAPCPPRRALPHPDALARARAAGASLWWTGRDGAVWVGLAGPLVVAPSGPPRDCDPVEPPAPGPPGQTSIWSTSRS